MLTPCLGRRDLLAAIHAGLTGRRWVTIVGPPGVGKTLAARHAALAMGGAVWIDLQGFQTLEEVVRECLQDLNCDLAPGDSDVSALRRALDDGNRLLVLDGIEGERVEGLAAFVESIITSTRDTKILCTATEPAGSGSELALDVGPLPIPAPHEPLEGAAVELFVSRVAGAGGALIDVSAADRPVRALLEASGGLPLLLEQFAVQAARVGLDNVVPFDSLSGAVAASYDLMDEHVRRACRRLAAMQVPIGLDVFAEVIESSRVQAIAISALLERNSLVVLDVEGRVNMLAPVRRQVMALAAGSDDPAAALAGIIRWADRALPVGDHAGLANAPWLAEMDTLTRAVAAVCADRDTLDFGYGLANRAFGALYTAMRPREALELLEIPLAAGEGPPNVGAQAARRAAIAASEVRGTFEGLSFLDRGEAHAVRCEDPTMQLAARASIRAEMLLDAGQLDDAFTEANRVFSLTTDGAAVRQARRTCMDVDVSRGNFLAAERLAPLIIDGAPEEERWVAIASRLLLGTIAWEQGRALEAAAVARSAREDALALDENRVALLADILYRRVTGQRGEIAPDIEQLPWAVRLGYQSQSAREALAAGDVARAAGLAADTIVLGDSSRLERDGIEARIVLADALLAQGDSVQAMSTYAVAVRRAVACPLPLRAADALDGIAVALASTRPGLAAKCAGAAYALRAPRGAVRGPRPGLDLSGIPPMKAPLGWVVDGALTQDGLAAIARADLGAESEPSLGAVAVLTKGQLAVAELVGQGMTSKEIAQRLYLSPRTVDNHLAQIYRRLAIPSRAHLAILMANNG